jgi:hypothetical protein
VVSSQLPTLGIHEAIQVIRGERVMLDADLARRVDDLAQVLDQRIGRHDRTLKQHEAAIQNILAEIRRLTRFPEPASREIGFTASWRDEPPGPGTKGDE